MKRLVQATIISFIFLFILVNPVLAASCEDTCENKSDVDKLNCLNDVRAACEAKLNEIQGQKTTLQSTINFLNSKISITQAQINQTQAEIDQLQTEIDSLVGKIDILNLSLDKLTQVLVNRIIASYKTNTIDPIYLLFTSTGFSDFLNRYQYLRVTQKHDQRIIFELEQARTNFDQQKTLKQDKQEQVLGLQTELVGQKQTLNSQKSAKQQLLEITKNDEQRFQELLAKSQAELAAIQAIIAGKGEEAEVRQVNEGERIASILTGGPNLYACSTGPHLHFEVAKDGGAQNPFNFLSNKSLEWDNPDPPQNGSGSWNWPLNDPIRITQGYGNTFYSSNYAGGIHTGVDMVNSGNMEVKAVKRGTLYRGSIGCRGGLLQYVRVKHTDDGYDTYYLHVNYY